MGTLPFDKYCHPSNKGSCAVGLECLYLNITGIQGINHSSLWLSESGVADPFICLLKQRVYSALPCIVHLYQIIKIWCNQSKQFAISQLHSYCTNVISVVAILLCNSLTCIPPKQKCYTKQSRPFYFQE